ncbi:hypothetical protein D3C78_1094480 [compost metagenome]
MEQLGHHRGHAVEVAGAAGAAQAFGNARDADDGLPGHAVGVHFLDGRGEQQLAAGLEEFFLVGGEGARIAVEVLAGAELQRVDEDAGDDEIGALGGFGHQRGMAGMQIAHGRHQADAFAFATGVGDGGAQFADGLDGDHAEKPCSGAGNRASLTARA